MDLCAIARQRLENYPSAIEYIRGFLDFHRCKQDKEALIAVAKNMTKQLLDPLTKEGIHLLNHIIMTEYSCNELIYHLVIRELHFLDDAQAKQ
jgi:hypothetical protein